MIETIQWGVLAFSLTGLVVSLCTVSFLAGFKRAMGQFRLSNPFGPAPLKPRVDQQYITDYEVMKNANSNLNREIVRLQLDKEGLQKEIKLLEGKIRLADRRRAKRDETLLGLYTASTADEYVIKYEEGKAQETKEEMQATVKKYARQKATASHAK
jgi:predicted  nucleic acid-binding Zn-ribbon protein